MSCDARLVDGDLFDHHRTLSALASCGALAPASLQSNAGDDVQEGAHAATARRHRSGHFDDDINAVSAVRHDAQCPPPADPALCSAGLTADDKGALSDRHRLASGVEDVRV